MAVEILGSRIPAYDLLLIAIGPVVLALMWLLLTRTRWGALVRAATQDREMVGALGVDQARLFTSVFFAGSVLAGLGGALQIPREPANLDLDLPSSPTPSWSPWWAGWAASAARSWPPS